MNKEQIIDEVYGKYADSHWTPPTNPRGKLLSDQLFSVVPMEHSKESFINEIKTNPEFAKQWGVTIYTVVEDGNIRIGINYNDKTIESYE
jgi:hypothetical protein